MGVWGAATGWEPTHPALLEGRQRTSSLSRGTLHGWAHWKKFYLEVRYMGGLTGRNVANYTYVVLYSSVILKKKNRGIGAVQETEVLATQAEAQERGIVWEKPPPKRQPLERPVYLRWSTPGNRCVTTNAQVIYFRWEKCEGRGIHIFELADWQLL